MKYTIAKRSVPSTDGIHKLFGKIYIPIGMPRATVQILHGMSENIERYDEFMSFLASNGFVVFGHDQLGHGKTAGSSESYGFFAEKNGDKLMVSDAYAYASELLESYKGLKHILIGHSMGSFVARICSEKYPKMADMIINLGTGGHQPLTPLGLAITDIGGRIKGADYRSEASQRFFYDICNAKFKDEDCNYSWVTRDKEVVEQYVDDEQLNCGLSIKAMNDLVMLSKECNSDEWFNNYRKDLPTLIMSGEMDPVGNNGKGVLEVFKRLEEEGVTDLSFKLYSECRHELLSELNKYDVMDDILRWINNRVE